jgi:hypothetical protein
MGQRCAHKFDRAHLVPARAHQSGPAGRGRTGPNQLGPSVPIRKNNSMIIQVAEPKAQPPGWPFLRARRLGVACNIEGCHIASFNF